MKISSFWIITILFSIFYLKFPIQNFQSLPSARRSGIGDTLPPKSLQLVSGGVFDMGCPEAYPPGCYKDEQPQHRVQVSDFYLCRYEVTNAEWVLFLNARRAELHPDAKGNTFHCDGQAFLYLQGPYSTVPQQIEYKNGVFSVAKGFEQHPAMRLSWFAAQAYCRWLRQQTGLPYRLPTEAEWEWAARGGLASRGCYYAGSNQIDSVAWYWDNAGKTNHPVAQKQPNELGCYDLSGNVWEWCSDWEGPYPDSAQANPRGPRAGRRRVARGGSWNYEAWNCRVVDRYYAEPGSMRHVIGFRLAMEKR